MSQQAGGQAGWRAAMCPAPCALRCALPCATPLATHRQPTPPLLPGVAFEGVTEERLYPSVGFRTPDEEVRGRRSRGATEGAAWFRWWLAGRLAGPSPRALPPCLPAPIHIPILPASSSLAIIPAPVLLLHGLPYRLWPTLGPTWRRGPSRVTWPGSRQRPASASTPPCFPPPCHGPPRCVCCMSVVAAVVVV